MYESELAPDEYKGTARQNPRAVPVISEKHVLPNSTSQSANEQEREKPQGFNNKTVTENTTIVTLKVEELTVSSPRKGDQKWDKGVSAKELLIKKLEPGEDERALSQVISQAISPRRSPSDMGMVGKVKEAVTSWIWNESTSTTLTNASTTSSSSSSAHIPISTDVHEGDNAFSLLIFYHPFCYVNAFCVVQLSISRVHAISFFSSQINPQHNYFYIRIM